MKHWLIFLFLFLSALSGTGQKAGTANHFIRLSEDNDGINAWFKGQDWGYTNGSSIDYFYHSSKKQRSNQKKNSFSPAYTTTGLGITQWMFTPQRTTPVIPDKNDYPYAGALLANYTRHRADPERHQNLQTEYVAGVMGPAAFAKETQVFLHRLIGDPRPNGWGYQLPADLLLNYNVTYEKQVWGSRHVVLAAGATGLAGTLQDGAAVFTMLRFQKNLLYFSGLNSQYFPVETKRPGFSFTFKTSADAMLYNAVLDGGLFNRHSPVRDSASSFGSDLHRKKFQASAEMRLHVCYRKFAVSFSQQLFTPDYKNYSGHNVGNLSLYAGL